MLVKTHGDRKGNKKNPKELIKNVRRWERIRVSGFVRYLALMPIFNSVREGLSHLSARSCRFS